MQNRHLIFKLNTKCTADQASQTYHAANLHTYKYAHLGWRLQVSPQLHFCKVENFAYGEIKKLSFRNPTPGVSPIH